MPTSPAPSRWPIAVAVSLVLVGAAGVAWWQRHAGVPTATAPPAEAPTTATATPAADPPAAKHPVDAAPAAPTPESPAIALPALADSDAPLFAALAEIAGDEPLARLIRHEFIIQRIVAAVDALPRRALAPPMLPVEPTGGRFAVAARDGGDVIAPENAARYARYATLLQQVPPDRAARLYLQYYPLFQQAYRELGYPDGYFNDRLVTVIDHLLATPDAGDPIALARPKVNYVFADPALEQLSAGQKLMLRIGPANADAARAWLRAYRTLITATPPTAPPGG